jgi:PAS domain S-box-containing protein
VNTPLAPRRRRFPPETVSGVAGIAALLTGALVLAGWWLNNDALKGVFPGALRMAPNSALGLAVAGVALCLVRKEPVPRLVSGLAVAAAAGASLVGLLTFAEYVSGRDLGIDRLLVPYAVDAGSVRPALHTALALALLGVSVGLMDLRHLWCHVASQFAAVLAILIALIALIGHACNVPPFYGRFDFCPSAAMVVPAAGAVAVLGVGVLCARPARGLMAILLSRGAGGLVARRLILAPVLVPLALGLVLRLTAESGGPYRADLGDWLFQLSNVTVFTLVIWWSARAVHRADERFHAVAETAPEAIVTADSAGRIVYLNATTERVFGYPAKEAIGRPLALFIPEQIPEGHARGLEEGLATGETRVVGQTAELTGRHRNGTEFPVEMSLAAWRAGPEIFFTVILHDITERKRAEEERRRQAGLAEVNRQLKKEVAERRRAEKALKEADRRKDEFLAMLAHELRNPLAPIRSAVGLMHLAGTGDSQLAWCRDVIDRQVAHLSRLVDDLLDVSRLTRGKIHLREEAVDLAAVVSQAVETVRPLMQERGHALTVVLPQEPISFRGDATRLAQVFGNLLHNAAKYSADGGRIALTAAREDGQVVVRVRDNGMGIARDVLPHIFEPFAQGDRALDRAQGGLGIGLTLVRRLVEMHGGTVAAHSDGPGLGSEFVVRLPAEPAAPPEAAPAAPDSRRGGEHRRVLVVDDNGDAAESLALLLQTIGHETRVAHDGPGALKEAETFGPDVVLLDIGLPGMDGYEVARRLRRLEPARSALLVAVTGYGQDEDRRRSKEAGFDHHFVKPVDPATLADVLHAGRAGA